MLACKPLPTLVVLAAYATVPRERWWQQGVHRSRTSFEKGLWKVDSHETTHRTPIEHHRTPIEDHGLEALFNSASRADVERMFRFAAAKTHRFVNENQELIKDEKRYLWCLHPHGLLADGWHSLIANDVDAFDEKGKGPPGVGRKVALCFAPVVQHVPVHQVPATRRLSGPSKASKMP